MSNDYTAAALIRKGAFTCACGKTHKASLGACRVAPGAIGTLGGEVRLLGGTKAYVLADENTLAAAGEQALGSLKESGIPYTLCLYPAKRAEPDEKTVGRAVLYLPADCDAVVTVGSGVLNDTGKILAGMKDLPYICVGTAPSMDGYASSTSSVIRDRLKVSVNSRCPDAVLADPAVLAAAPKELLLAGLGDMLAKYVSVCEWRIGRLVTGEYYCETVAEAIRAALSACMEGARGLLRQDPAAAAAVMDGLVVSGIAADWAGVSRPVSGTEHYFSHIWDMRAAALGTPCSLHGIQCAVGTLKTLKGYEILKRLLREGYTPEPFDKAAWLAELSAYMGAAGGVMLKNAEACDLYDPEKQAARQKNIKEKLPEILRVIDEELPAYGEIDALLQELGAPRTPEDLGIPESETAVCFKATKDIRDKYILSSLAFDLGCLDRIAREL